jgi:hypothetical protein
MTLDEMIAWCGEESARSLRDQNDMRRVYTDERIEGDCAEYIERAATLLAIENALRAVRDGVALETV